MKSVLYIVQLVILTADLTFTKTAPTSQHKLSHYHKTKSICKVSCQVLCTPECDFKCCLPQPKCASYCPQSCYPDCKPDCCGKSPEALRDNLKCPGRCRIHCYAECDASCCISTRTNIVEQSSIARLTQRNDLDGSNWQSTGTQRSLVMKYCPPLCPRHCLPLCSASCCAILPPVPPLQGICPQQCMYFCHPYCEPKCCVQQSHDPSRLQTSHSLPIPRRSFPKAPSIAPPLYQQPLISCPLPCQSKCFPQCTRECCKSLNKAPDVIVLIPRPPDVCPAPCPSSCYPKCDKDCCCSKASQAANGICALI